MFGHIKKGLPASPVVEDVPLTESVDDFELREGQRRIKERQQQLQQPRPHHSSQERDRRTGHANGHSSASQERNDRRPAERPLTNGHGHSRRLSSHEKNGMNYKMDCADDPWIV